MLWELVKWDQNGPVEWEPLLVGRLYYSYVCGVEDMWLETSADSGLVWQSIDNTINSKKVNNTYFFYHAVVYSSSLPLLLIKRERVAMCCSDSQDETFRTTYILSAVKHPLSILYHNFQLHTSLLRQYLTSRNLPPCKARLL